MDIFPGTYDEQMFRTGIWHMQCVGSDYEYSFTLSVTVTNECYHIVCGSMIHVPSICHQIGELAYHKPLQLRLSFLFCPESWEA